VSHNHASLNSVEVIVDIPLWKLNQWIWRRLGYSIGFALHGIRRYGSGIMVTTSRSLLYRTRQNNGPRYRDSIGSKWQLVQRSVIFGRTAEKSPFRERFAKNYRKSPITFPNLAPLFVSSTRSAHECVDGVLSSVANGGGNSRLCKTWLFNAKPSLEP
jgi:hypothetical protein